MVWLYTSRDMVLCLRKGEVFGCVGKVYLLQVLLTSISLADYFTNCWGTKSSLSQVPTVLLTTALMIWLNDHL